MATTTGVPLPWLVVFCVLQDVQRAIGRLQEAAPKISVESLLQLGEGLGLNFEEDDTRLAFGDPMRTQGMPMPRPLGPRPTYFYDPSSDAWVPMSFPENAPSEEIVKHSLMNQISNGLFGWKYYLRPLLP